MTRNTDQSSRIVNEAKRIITLTTQIDAALDLADSLADSRREALLEIARLTGVGGDGDLEKAVRADRTAFDTAVVLIARAGPAGISREKLMSEIAGRIEGTIDDQTLDLVLERLLTSKEIHQTADGYGLGVPPIARLRMGGHTSREQYGYTHRDMILTVLRSSPEPLGIRAIIQAVSTRFDANIGRASVSPLLTKMDRVGGLVVHVGDRWTVPEADRSPI